MNEQEELQYFDTIIQLVRSEKAKKAAKMLQEVIDKYPANPRYLLAYAYMYIGQYEEMLVAGLRYKGYEDVLAYCEKGMDTLPEAYHPALYVCRARIMIDMMDGNDRYFKKYETKVSELYNAAIALSPNDPMLYKYRADYDTSLPCDANSGKADYDKASSLDGSFNFPLPVKEVEREVMDFLNTLERRYGEFLALPKPKKKPTPAKAKKMFAEAEDIRGGIQNIGVAAYAQPAIDIYKELLEYFPDAPEYLYSLADICYAIDDEASAKTHYNQAFRLTGTSAQALEIQARQAFREKQYKQAETLFLQALELNPDYHPARETLIQLYYFILERFDQAFEHCDYMFSHRNTDRDTLSKKQRFDIWCWMGYYGNLFGSILWRCGKYRELIDLKNRQIKLGKSLFPHSDGEHMNEEAMIIRCYYKANDEPGLQAYTDYLLTQSPNHNWWTHNRIDREIEDVRQEKEGGVFPTFAETGESMYKGTERQYLK